MVRRRDCLRLLATGLAVGVTGAGRTAASPPASGSESRAASTAGDARSSAPVAALVAKLVAPDREADDGFGSAVALDGDTGLVGAPDDGSDGDGTGRAYLFGRTAEGWRRRTELVPGNAESAPDRFGEAVTLDGDTAVVGAGGAPEAGTGTGTAYVFERSGGDWHRTAAVAVDDAGRFGEAVAVDGGTVLVGASGGDPNWESPGAAYAFERADDGFDRVATLVPGDGDINDQFGSAVALDGDTAVVGAPDDEDPNGHAAGSAYAFERSGGGWRQAAKLLPGDGEAGDGFGRAVAVDGDTGLVGASLDDNANGDGAGAAYAFDRTGGDWSRREKLVAPDGEANDGFGRAVAVDGDAALVGAGDWISGTERLAGATYLFGRTDGGWRSRATLRAPDGDNRDRFGDAVALDGTTLLAGAPGDEEPNGYGSGSAYVFERGAEPVAPDVTGDGNRATDPDGDGLYEDVNGDGEAFSSDATVLFDAAFEGNPAVTGNPALFDFTGDGEVTPADATVLFREVF